MKYTYDYPMFSLAVDIAVVDESSRILLIRRGGDVNTGKLALPGGFVDINETLKQAAVRELKEETNLDIKEDDLYHDLILDDVDRDPRGRVVSYQYTVYLERDFESYDIIAGDDASSVEFLSVYVDTPLAFDHNKVIDYLRASL